MSSSTFEVTETESETEKEISFGLEACEENGIGISVDGEVPKDHNYTKDPDESEEEDKADNSQTEESEKNESSPEKRSAKNARSQRAVKKSNVSTKTVKPKREASPKKETPKRGKAKKEVLTEESNKTDGEKINSEQSLKTPKRGKKRKVEEKENVIDRSIVEEVQNINESDATTEASAESPAKKKNIGSEKTSKAKQTKAKSTPVIDGENNHNLPGGWVRKEVVRKTGKSAGQVDVYIYSPDGIKFRSRPDIAAYLSKTNTNLKLEDFNFSRKKTADTAVKASPKKEKPTPTVKPKNISEKKKKVQSSSTPTKKGSKLVVKLNFSPKSKKGKNVKKATHKPAKQSPVKKAKASGSNAKVSKKKKSA